MQITNVDILWKSNCNETDKPNNKYLLTYDENTASKKQQLYKPILSCYKFERYFMMAIFVEDGNLVQVEQCDIIKFWAVMKCFMI